RRPRVPRGVIDELDFQCREETLGDRVVPAIAPAAHAADDPALLQDALVVTAGILISAIGVMEQARRRRRRASAMARAPGVRSSVMRSLIAQPTAKREQRSRITAR